MGVGAPVTHDGIWPQGPKKARKGGYNGFIRILKHALQMNFSPIKKLPSFTKVMNKVQNIKNNKFSFKWPKRL